MPAKLEKQMKKILILSSLLLLGAPLGHSLEASSSSSQAKVQEIKKKLEDIIRFKVEDAQKANFKDDDYQESSQILGTNIQLTMNS